MSTSRQIIVYSILRLLLFAVPFTVFMLLNIEWWASALLATVIAVCLSYLLLLKQRHALAAEVATWGKGKSKDADNDLENEALDAAAEAEAEAGAGARSKAGSKAGSKAAEPKAKKAD